MEKAQGAEGGAFSTQSAWAVSLQLVTDNVWEPLNEIVLLPGSRQSWRR